jgi:hypothetical protein
MTEQQGRARGVRGSRNLPAAADPGVTAPAAGTSAAGPTAPGGGGSAAPPKALPVLEVATRQLLKGTLVPLQVDTPVLGSAVLKHGYLRQLGLQHGEVEAVRHMAIQQGPSLDEVPWNLLALFEAPPAPSLRPAPAAFAAVSAAGLRAFGEALATLRRSRLAAAPAGPQPRVPGTATAAALPGAGVARALVNQAVVANAGFDFNLGTTPVGMLNLERLDMAPAGIVKGELVATIPLAPLEETAVTQKEWSATSQEFTSIVTDSLVNYSEKGVTDNTELDQSTTSQLQHNNQFNITGTVRGGIPIISGSVTSGFTSQDASSQSATDSRKHAVTTTQQASSRSKQEHKLTISTTTVTGTSEATTRTLTNPSPTDPIRIDYFSMMRDWRVRLYRYGLRLTYDIVIPEPGGAMRQAYATLAELQAQLGPFEFNVRHGDITTEVWAGETEPHYLVLADRYGATVPTPPPPGPTLTPNQQVPGLDDSESWHFCQLTFTVPDGYWVTDVTANAHVGIGDNYGAHYFAVEGTPFFDHSPQAGYQIDLTAQYNFMTHYTGPQSVTFFFQEANVAWVGLTVTTAATDDTYAQWQSDVWNALYGAAQTQYYALQQNIAAQIAALQDQLDNVDTLTLRREESDEIMKGALLFLLGVDFDLMPSDVLAAFQQASADVTHGVGFLGTAQGSLGISAANWSVVNLHEDQVRFINQAIEWENVVTFLYSYFWDIPASWAFIRSIKHPDPDRQAFLRAGSARVVLTVRKGWEQAWVTFAEGGFAGAPVPPDHPYLTIAQEIAAYDDRNYPGIPPATPDGSTVRLEDAIYTTCTAAVGPDPGQPAAPVSIPVEDSTPFLIGAQVVIDVYDDRKVQEATTVTATPDATHLVVAQLTHDHTTTPFPVIQPGENGALIAEWHEYTPTSGTDIAVTSNLSTIN